MPQEFAIQAFEKCEALKAQIEVTTRCNFKCGFCYNLNRDAPDAKGDPGLSTAEWKDIIRQIADLGVIELTFTGGEASLRSDLAELIQCASSHHLIVNLRTNGSLLNPRRLESYAEAGLQDLMVTLYGFSAETHDRFTGFKGSFEKTLENLEKVTKRYPKLRTFITITVLAHNYHEIELKSVLEDRLQASIQANIVCHGRNDLSLDAQEHAVPLNEHVKLRPPKAGELRLLDSLKLEMRRHSDVDVHEYLYSSGRTELLHHVLKFPGKPATSRRHPFGKSGTTLKFLPAYAIFSLKIGQPATAVRSLKCAEDVIVRHLNIAATIPTLTRAMVKLHIIDSKTTAYPSRLA